MKAVLSLLLAASGVSAHYIFEKFAVGSTQYPTYEYIRYNTNYNSPVIGMLSLGSDSSLTRIIISRAPATTFKLTTRVQTSHRPTCDATSTAKHSETPPPSPSPLAGPSRSPLTW